MVLLSVMAMAAAVALGEAKADPAAEAAPAAAVATAAEKPAKPKKICVEETRMGSHFRQRICATKEEWDQRRLRDAEAMARDGSNRATCSGNTC
ncbi:hypothetical protein [uncultured Phenylobacterium sp.]|uniref:hypothetical protein n=1 Tax=uncultured Phenylobacterium sp. TaxID=349273 RepID=UPI0025F654C4|nr:hypothetical protein [uncultured Phenylobacterium sp.]